jgi:outer membrane protein assembly factor BamB
VCNGRHGSRTWAHLASGAWDMFTPAVDDRYVYHYNGGSLFLIDRLNGQTVHSVEDPLGSSSAHSYHGSPMIGGSNNVIAFARGAFSGRASSQVEQYEQRVLSSFNIATATYQWSTANSYLTTPAVAKGVIYAARNSPMSLDAIDERTGRLIWSWVPVGSTDASFHRNIVVTDNVVFVSTDRNVYALDLATKKPVWSLPAPGMLAISGDWTLYIATGATGSDGRLIAVNLK